jgi:serine/threonine protein kinase
MSESGIFKVAVKLPPNERAAFLDQTCAADKELRREVESLLRAHDASGSFLQDSPLGSPATVAYEPIPERPGTVIGPYKLMEQIGEGGMGLVFVAEQQQPVRRKVALKIIRPGMDSRQVLARFEAERQALALMDHQNIAKVYDAGTTESGRPYFVMELIHGVPLTEYCDANQLTPRQRLELFVPVCQAIQHAHQKGIIHRDIKPSNILVTMYDDHPVPKVIDFGVAKAIEQRLTEKTVYTQFGTLVGTFEYMSPEQAELNAFGVDTRSDIYSLGVLLYELLTGTTPLERARLREAAFGEIIRLIKEEEPPRPSVRLSTSGALPKVAAARKTDPARLSKLLRGELDWIVIRCLEKDRARRYDTASGLARDVERYLKDEPVEARPPSALYRFGKFARRNRAALLTTALVAAALVVGTALSTWQAVRATQAEELARARLADVEAANKEVQRNTALLFRIGDPELLTPAPSWETWQYPGSRVVSSVRGGGSGTVQMEFGNTERFVLVTPDEFDKVWAFYKGKCQIPEDRNGSSYGPWSQMGRQGHQTIFKLRNDVHAFSFAGPKSDALTARAFTVHSLRYQLVGFVYRPKGAESTCILLAYRPNTEFVSILRDRVVKE